MFVKPVELSVLGDSSSWLDKAGNTHFVLQSKKKDGNVMRSFMSGLSGLTVASSSDAQYRKSLMEYDFRILLRFISRKKDYVVAVDESFDKIHNVSSLLHPWNIGIIVNS